MSIISELIAQLEMNYYARLILLITELIALVVGIVKYKTLGTAKAFVWYIVFDLTFFITSIAIDTLKLIPEDQLNLLDDIINLSVSIIEVWVYFYYFKIEMPLVKITKFITPLLALISLYLFLKLIFDRVSDNFSLEAASYLLSSISFLLIFPLSLISMLQLLRQKEIFKIHRVPRFWITIGILYYSAISIPFYFFRGFFDMEHEIKVLLDTVLFYSPFTLNLICILIAFVCKKPVKN